jgi:hypothetical protein
LATVTARVLSLLGSDSSLSTAECESICATRYELLHDTFGWARRTRDFTLSTVAQTSSGTTDTVTVTLASATVTSAGTPFLSTMDGYQIAIDGVLQYFFVVYSSTSVVTLADGEGNAVLWPVATNTTAAWRVFKTLYTLPTNTSRVETLAGQMRLEEYEGGRTALDLDDPYRTATAAEPTHWLYAGEDTSNVKQVELWPVPTSARLLRGQYLKSAGTLASGTYIDIPVPMLVFSAAADCCHLLHAKLGSSETMFENMALFFERKVTEISTDYKVVDQAERSLPTQIGRSTRRGGGQRSMGADYYVSRMGPWE